MLALTRGGRCLSMDGQVATDETTSEYRGVYERFAVLLDQGRSDVDDAPFRLLADAFLVGRRTVAEPFED